MTKAKKLIIIGDSAFAEVAYECFTHDSDYEVVGFAVEEQYLKKKELFGLPIVEFGRLEKCFDPGGTEFYAALVYTQMNRLRTRLYNAAKNKGFQPASYISSKAFVWNNAVIGEHSFIFENNTIQPFVKIGSNVVLWSGNHIGHHTEINDNCFIASHAVISGFCSIGKNSFIGVNATLSNNVSIGDDNWIGISATVIRDTENNTLIKGVQSEPFEVSAKSFFKVHGG